MSESSQPRPPAGEPELPAPLSPLLVARGAIGGTLMGLANLVPGISGGTMLLAAGVYPGFIAAIADLTTLRFRTRSIVLLASIVGAAGLAVLALAGAVKDLVEAHRWLMYSLFIGLTLGGVPLLWRMARPASPGLLAAAALAFGLMLGMALLGDGASDAQGRSYALIFVSGLAASSAMILPGVSGAYLLLLLGQYEAILGTVDRLKGQLLAALAQLRGTENAPLDWAVVLDALQVLVPLGLGVAVGVVGVSNLLRWLLARFEKPTLGVLLGLLLGSVVGLWPFQEPRAPAPGDVIKGRVVTAASLASIDPEDWRLSRFDPNGGQAALSMTCIGLGLGATLLIGRLNPRGREDSDPSPPPTALRG